MKYEISKKWIMDRAGIEDGCSVEAGHAMRVLLEHKKTKPPLDGTYWFIDNGSSSRITERRAKELIHGHYDGKQHAAFPQWDGAFVSLGTNQFIRFEESRIKQPSP